MFLNKIFKWIFLFSLLISAQGTQAQKNGKKELDADRKLLRKSGNTFNWELLNLSHENSINIDTIHLSGIWKAYNGLFVFNGMVNSMNLFKPLVIEIKGNNIKRSEGSTFISFAIKDNSLLIDGKEPEEGFINLFADQILVISWKNGSNYTRYYYERAE